MEKGGNMKIYLIEINNNKELYKYLKNKYILVYNLNQADVVIVNKVYNIKLALDLIDYALMKGKEVICIKNKYAKEHYVCNYLIKNGAMYI